MSDWDTVTVLRKRAPKASAMKTEGAINQVRGIVPKKLNRVSFTAIAKSSASADDHSMCHFWRIDVNFIAFIYFLAGTSSGSGHWNQRQMWVNSINLTFFSLWTTDLFSIRFDLNLVELLQWFFENPLQCLNFSHLFFFICEKLVPEQISKKLSQKIRRNWIERLRNWSMIRSHWKLAKSFSKAEMPKDSVKRI